MQAGIDALMDVMAPPVRAPRDASAPADDGPSFADHLDAAEPSPQPERPQRVEASDGEEDAPATDDVDDTGADAEPAQAAAPPPPQQNCAPPVAPLTLQIIDTMNAAVAASDDAAASDAAAASAEADAAQPQNQPAPPVVAPVIAKPHAAKSREAAKTADAAPIAEPTESSEAAPEVVAAKPASEAKTASTTEKLDAPQTSAPQSPAQSAQQPQPAQQLQHIAQAPHQPAQAPAQQPAQDAAQASDSADVMAAPTPKNAQRIAAPAPTSDAQGQPTGEERGARSDAPVQASNDKQAPTGPPPTAAPRETFTALLAQQENALQPAAPQALHAAAPTTSAQSAAAATAPHAAALATPTSQVGREIIRKFSGGTTRFELRLDPPELGRVEVKLEVSRDHRVTAVVAADSPQTLSELTRHARDLEQALQSAGLELSDNGLSFDLSQREHLADTHEEQNNRRGGEATVPEEAAPIPTRALTLDAWRGARVDLVA